MINPIKKLKDMPLMLKATIVFAIANFATSGINYITTPIFTELLSTAEYGTVAVYNSWFDIIKVFASMTLIYPGVLNVGLYDHKDNRWKYLSSMLGITTFCTLVLGGLYAIFYSTANSLLGLPPSLVILMLVTSVFTPATIFWTFKQRYEYAYKITFLVSVGSAVVAQIVSIVAVILAKNHGVENLAEVRLWSAGLFNILVAIVLFGYICIKGKCFLDFSIWKPTFIVALPLIPHYLGSVVLSSTDKIMIDRMVSEEKAGIYSLAAILSAIGVLMWRALSVTFTPFVNAKLGERDFLSIRNAVKPLLVMVGLVCVIASLAAPEIINILATDEYLEGIYVVPPIAAGIFIHALYDNFSAVSFFHKKSAMIMTATLTAAVINIVLNYFFIKNFGFIAAGYTTLISNVVLSGMHYYNTRRIEKEKIYDFKFSLVSTALVVAGCLACNLIYELSIIRYVLIVAVLCLMILKSKSVIKAIVDMKV